MILNECIGCRYCQKRWNMDQYGRYTDYYYSCTFPPHWFKPVCMIGSCPQKDEKSKVRNS